MSAYYTRTFLGMAIVLSALVAAAIVANSVAADTKAKHLRLMNEGAAGARERASQQERVMRLQRAMSPVRDFAKAWLPVAKLSEKAAAERVRSDIESIAQRQLGLVTDSAITPQPERYLFQGAPIRIQRVSLRASGKDLAALLAWVGKVEEKYPAAVVEWCEFSSNVGGNTGLTIRLVQPVTDASAHRPIVTPGMHDALLQPDAIAMVAWQQYLPASVKGAGAVGFQRNPLQPAVPAEHRTLPTLRDESDEITPRLEMALDGRVRSVIRGATPIVVIEGRIFRVGDELVIGGGREKPVPDARTRLKQIADDRLIFHVAGGTTDRPIQCDVTYLLPSFLKAR